MRDSNSLELVVVVRDLRIVMVPRFAIAAIKGGVHADVQRFNLRQSLHALVLWNPTSVNIS
jgi:hypothetical protein